MYGTLGKELTAFLKDLGGRIAPLTKETLLLDFLIQRLSVAIQRGQWRIHGGRCWDASPSTGLMLTDKVRFVYTTSYTDVSR